MNLNDTIFMFLCTLLVWLMTPGLSLFYGGLVQSKNALNTVMQKYGSDCAGYICLGYSRFYN